MMLCKADLQELFPELFPPEPEPPVLRMETPLDDVLGLARREHDGSLPLAARRRAAAAPGADDVHETRELARA